MTGTEPNEAAPREKARPGADEGPACPLCGGATVEAFVRLGRSYLRCGACSFLHVPAGLLRCEDGRTIYEQDENLFFRDGNERYYLDESNLRSCARKLDWVRRHAPAGWRLLDAGANFGHFLKVAAEVYDARGFDISPQAVEWSRRSLGVRNQVASLYELPAGLAGPWDVVTSWDVLEHLPEPLAAVARLRDLVRVGGVLFLSTPDAGSLVARLMGSRWHYLDPVQHLSLFNARNLARVLESRGFEVLERRTFGHYYRLEYIWDRLRQLHPSGVLHAGARLGKWTLAPLRDRMLYLELGDVMGLAARRRQ